MKPLAVKELQQEGHRLIDAMVQDGMGRNEVYEKLGMWLGEKNVNHFSKTQTVEQALKVVKCLRVMRKARMLGVRPIPKNYPYWVKRYVPD